MVSNTERIAMQFEELRKAINDLSRAVGKRRGKKTKSGSKSFLDEDESDGRKKNHDEGRGKGLLRDYRKLKVLVFEGERFKKMETAIDSVRSEFKQRHAEMMKLPLQQAETSRPPPTPKMAMPASTNGTQLLIQSSGLVFDEHEIPLQEANSEKVGRRPISGLSDTKPMITATIINKCKENKKERGNGKKVLPIEEKRSSIGRQWSSEDIVDDGGYQATKILSAEHSKKFGFHLGPDLTQPNGDFLYFFYPP